MGLFAFRRMQEREAAAKAVASAPKPAETKAPRMGKKYTAEVKLWYQTLAFSSDKWSASPVEVRRNWVIKMINIPFIP